MIEQLNSAVTRIHSNEGAVVGAGFLVGERHVLTCAHVVARALGLPDDTPDPPSDGVHLTFPLIDVDEPLAAQVTCWHPTQDVVGLTVTEPPPAAEPVQLVETDALWDHKFGACGFPEGYSDGVWTSGLLRNRTGAAWIQLEGLDEDLLSEAVDAIKDLPHGEEVAQSLITLAQMAPIGRLAQLEAVVQACEDVDWLAQLSEPSLRPRVIEALRGLLDVATEVQRFLQASSPAVQAAALNRAIGMLEELESYTEDILVPERHLLQLIIDRWQSLVAKASGRLGDRTLWEMAPSTRRALGMGAERRQATLWSRPAQPFPNPYKTGDPVSPPLFVGRGDIFNRIQEIWAGKANPDSIILYGHRRMGKSSILRNLGDYAPKGSLLVYVDLKGETAFDQSPRHLLRALAEEVTWSAQDKGLNLPEPDPADYTGSAEASLTFKQFLRRALQVLPGEGSLILALDEFEAVDVAVREGKIGRKIYDYLRMLSQEPRLVIVFAGLHTLDEMSRDYREAFFDSYVNLPVSYLPPEAAERLIARPTMEFPLSYHPDVIAQVIEQTHGQPLLVQRICQELVNHINHELSDLELEREARMLPEDLDTVLDDAFVRSETRYFEGIWNDQIAGRPAAEATLEVLTEGPASLDALTQTTEFTKEDVSEALEYLETRDLVACDEDGRWDLLVPLMCRWLRLRGR